MCKSKRSIAIPILNIISALVKKLGLPHLKDPFFTDEIDVKKPERVAVLGYLFLLALAIYRVFQRRVRPFITPEHPLKGPGGRKLTRPTGQAIFQLFPLCERRRVPAAGRAHPTRTGSLPHPGSAKDSARIGHGREHLRLT
ncbi:hypothetical protein GT50_15245 [Geobacillus stearothermophilus 10]|nr:hypothetical protein GT50_15245 [Geobacillus stearothermophilus 10]